jgi:hypothetical protein
MAPAFQDCQDFGNHLIRSMNHVFVVIPERQVTAQNASVVTPLVPLDGFGGKMGAPVRLHHQAFLHQEVHLAHTRHALAPNRVTAAKVEPDGLLQGPQNPEAWS